MDDPSTLPPRKMQIALGETVRDFMQVNGLPAEDGRVDTPDHNHYAVALDVIADTGPIIFGDHWIAPSVKLGTQSFELPAGRTLFIDQEAGRIKSFTFTPNAKAQPLLETNRLVKPMLDWFLGRGTRSFACALGWTIPTGRRRSTAWSILEAQARHVAGSFAEVGPP